MKSGHNASAARATARVSTVFGRDGAGPVRRATLSPHAPPQARCIRATSGSLNAQRQQISFAAKRNAV
jgi:hypothetical protein